MATSKPIKSLLVLPSQRLATCWRIERADSTILRFTDFPHEITLDGYVYSPLSSVSASARKAETGGDSNVDIRGVLDSDTITTDDLEAGLYESARVYEIVVDWQYPFAGHVAENVFVIESVRWTGEIWDARLSSLPFLLKNKTGYLYTRSCRWRLGDANCGINLATYTRTGTVGTLNQARLEFESTISGAACPDDWFTDGVITWTSGDNDGLSSEVRLFLAEDNVLSLHFQTPFDIAPGDTFSITPGCDGLFDGGCGTDKFNNKVRFGGFPDIPGTDRLYDTPVVE